MRRYRGPCWHCGTYIDREFRHGREKLCIDCAVEKIGDTARAWADGTHPAIAARDRANAELAEQIAAREGPRYEKWRAALLRAAGEDPSTPA